MKIPVTHIVTGVNADIRSSGGKLIRNNQSKRDCRGVAGGKLLKRGRSCPGGLSTNVRYLILRSLESCQRRLVCLCRPRIDAWVGILVEATAGG
jgi:hypothetical protein